MARGSLATLARESLRVVPPPATTALARPVYTWRELARPEQIEPLGDWRTWLILAGRGWGKTRSGAEWVCDQVEAGARRIALVGRTVEDVRDVMIQGESGILEAARRRGMLVRYEPSKRRLIWANGAIATSYSADKPDQLRGPQHDRAWLEEVAAWRYPAAYHNLMFGLRLGKRPRCLITTTPRPTPLIRNLLKAKGTHPTRGTTYENAANLDPDLLAEWRSIYEGTRLGRQELEAELLDDAPGALFKRAQIDALRVATPPSGYLRVLVCVDPATTTGENSDETGIIVVALGDDGQGYVLHDATGKYLPGEWAGIVVGLYHHYQADCVVAESNQGGQMVEETIRTADDGVPIVLVHSRRGKAVRAEPISMLYEQGKVHHVGCFPKLEDQMCGWEPGASDSPDGMDALVHGMTDLLPMIRSFEKEKRKTPKYGEPGYIALGDAAFREREAARLERLEQQYAEQRHGMVYDIGDD